MPHSPYTCYIAPHHPHPTPKMYFFFVVRLGPLSNTWFVGPIIQPNTANVISIDSAIFPEFAVVTSRQTDRRTELLRVCSGYSLQLLARSTGSSEYQYSGEWVSPVVPITNSSLCVSIALSVPASYHVTVDLLTNSSRKTVYTADSVVGETVATDMLTVFEVEVDAAVTSYGQFVVYVSDGSVIRDVDIQNDQCNTSGQSVTN